MSRYSVVAISSEGVALGFEEYDPRGDTGRDARVRAAAEALGQRLGLEVPSGRLARQQVSQDGTVWFRSSVPIDPGMVEVGWGKWGFNSARNSQSPQPARPAEGERAG